MSKAESLNWRTAILDAAEELMVEIGYDRTSIAQICRRSGSPVGSVYYHFGSKAGVLLAVMDRACSRFFATLPEYTASADMSSEQRMREYWEAAPDGIHANLSYFILSGDLERFKNTDAAIAAAAATVRHHVDDHLTAVITDFARDAGVVNVGELSARLIRTTIIYTRGAVLEAGTDLNELRQLLHELHQLIHAAIVDAARTPGRPISQHSKSTYANS